METTAPRPDERDVLLRTLMVRYQEGDMDAFQEFYARTRTAVHRYHLAHSTAELQAGDLTQDTYLQLHRSRRLYNPDFPVMPWLLAIARHVRLMAARRWRRQASREVAFEEHMAEPAVDVNALLDRAVLAQALERLPQGYRDPLVLHHLLGLSFREIAGIVGSSEVGARIRATRGMAALRRVLRQPV